jgi:hypothetical protein
MSAVFIRRRSLAVSYNNVAKYGISYKEVIVGGLA